MFYLGIIRFRNGNSREFSASSLGMLHAKIDAITDGIKNEIIKVDVYRAEKVNEFAYED